MLTLASMIWAAFFWVADEIPVKNRPLPPVVIETGTSYSYNDIESAITVPLNWNDSCYNQSQVIWEMEKHFNNFRNGNQKLSNDKLLEIQRKWVCVTDEAK